MAQLIQLPSGEIVNLDRLISINPADNKAASIESLWATGEGAKTRFINRRDLEYLKKAWTHPFDESVMYPPGYDPRDGPLPG